MKSSSNLFKSENSFTIPAELLQEKPYVEITNNIEVNVWPEFIDKKSSILGEIYIWAYHVRIANNSLDEIQLESRYWRPHGHQNAHFKSFHQPASPGVRDSSNRTGWFQSHHLQPA
jgi:hypothetical protein